MQEIASYQIEINKALDTKELLNIYQLATQMETHIYLYNKQSMADAHNLPELLSFFFVNPHEEVLLIIEGNHAKQAYKQLLPLLTRKLQTV